MGTLGGKSVNEKRSRYSTEKRVSAIARNRDRQRERERQRERHVLVKVVPFLSFVCSSKMQHPSSHKFFFLPTTDPTAQSHQKAARLCRRAWSSTTEGDLTGSLPRSTVERVALSCLRKKKIKDSQRVCQRPRRRERGGGFLLVQGVTSNHACKHA